MDLNTSLAGPRSTVRMSQHAQDFAHLYGLTEEDITKALTLDSGNGSAAPMVGESLDPVVHFIVLNGNAYTPTWRRLKTYKAKSFLEQFNVVNSLGKGRFGGSATSEGNLGTFDSSGFERVTEQQRNFGQVGVISRTAQRAADAKFGDLKATEAFNRLTKLTLDGEVNIWWGDPTKNPYMFRGLIYQIKSISNNQNVVNKATTGTTGTNRETYIGGGVLDIDSIQAYMEAPLEHGGIHTALYCAPSDKIALSGTESAKQRWNNLMREQSRLEVGVTVDQITNPLGPPVDVAWSIFFKNGGRINPYGKDPANSALFHLEAPVRMAAPGSGATAQSVSAGGKLPVDEYYYAVAAINEKAEGKMGISVVAVTTTNDNGIANIPVVHGSDVSTVHSYALYRSTTLPASADDFAKMRFVKEVAVASGAVPGGEQVLTDDGTIIPGSTIACLADESALSLPELLKPTIRDLADVDNSHRFSIDHEFSPLAHDKALREVLWENIGGSVTDPS